jgi:hypothetical protein
VRTGLQRSFLNVTTTINPPKETQSIFSPPHLSLRSATVQRPTTTAGKFIARRFRVDPALADVVADLAGLGQEAR